MRLSILSTIALAGLAAACVGAVCDARGTAQPAVAPAHRGQFTEYPIPFGDPVASGITLGPDGAIWYADFGDNSIGRVTLHGKISEYPDDLNGPNGIVAGPDGALWFTETSRQSIGRITIHGNITHFGQAERYPQSITNGPDGALWFTAFSRVGRITTKGAITHFRLAPPRTEFEGIATGPDGALWITRYIDRGSRFSNQVVRLTTTGAKTTYTVGYGPQFITTGPDGALWFTETGAGKIGRLTTNGGFSEFPLQSSLSPVGIAAGPDNALWFTAGSSIGRITTRGRITLYPIPPPCAGAQEITAGPDHAMWFTCGAIIGRITTR